MKNEIAVLVSGGVDSALALALLKEKGQRVRAYYIKIWLENDSAFSSTCPWEEDLFFVRHICQRYAVPLEEVNLQYAYYQSILLDSLEELKQGFTPSPDIFCNQKIKFKAFFDYLAPHTDKIASGHYAHIVPSSELSSPYRLYKAYDRYKDQSYFLSRLNQSQLRRLIFPLHAYSKQEVRYQAAQRELINAQRPDSQGLCFLGKFSYPQFLKYYLGERKGNICDFHSHKILAQHSGHWFYTIGQRKGLDMGGGPWFVVYKNIEENIVYVTHQEKWHLCQFHHIYVKDLFWIAQAPRQRSLSLKLRHGPRMHRCWYSPLSDNSAWIYLKKGELGIAPGQFCVFYQGEECLGSAKIISVSE